MIPVTQTKVVIKNSKGEIIVRGNCYAACIASILELPITEVPNVEVFYHMDNGYHSEVMLTFLQSKGWDLCNDERYRCFHTVFTDKNYSEMDKMQKILKDDYYLASGKSARGVQHICIFKNGNLVHDPHPSKEGILTFDYFQSITN